MSVISKLHSTEKLVTLLTEMIERREAYIKHLEDALDEHKIFLPVFVYKPDMDAALKRASDNVRSWPSRRDPGEKKDG